jgi:hypothetical protein
VALSLAGMLLLGGCDSLATTPLPGNPFAATPEVVIRATSAPAPQTPLVASPTPSFAAYWVKNHRQAEMWSGPAGQPGVISFGTTSAQFCVFEVVRPQEGARLYVLNPLDRNYFWIDADAVGPVAEPPRRATGPRPTGVNCSDQTYEP